MTRRKKPANCLRASRTERGGTKFLDYKGELVPFTSRSVVARARSSRPRSSLERFFERGSLLLLRGSAHAESRRMAGRPPQPASSEGRAIQRPFTHHPFLFSALPPTSSFSYLSQPRPIPAIVAVSTRRYEAARIRGSLVAENDNPILLYRTDTAKIGWDGIVPSIDPLFQIRSCRRKSKGGYKGCINRQ